MLFFIFLFQEKTIKTESYLFSHGFADTLNQFCYYVKNYKWLGRGYENKSYILYNPVKSFNFPDAMCKHVPNLYYTSLGQKNEIEALRKAYRQMDKEKETENGQKIYDDKRVLAGVSRGASTIINFLAKDKPDKVKAAILESPFDHMESIIMKHWFIELLAKLPFLSKERIYNIFCKITQYQDNGAHTINLVDKIDKNIPVMFVCSKTDKSVPYLATINLYKKLIKSGHKRAHLLRLANGRHARFLQNDEVGEKYQNVIHAFYKKYGLKHDDALAAKGEADFGNCSPGIDQLDKDSDLADGVENSL